MSSTRRIQHNLARRREAPQVTLPQIFSFLNSTCQVKPHNCWAIQKHEHYSLQSDQVNVECVYVLWRLSYPTTIRKVGAGTTSKSKINHQVTQMQVTQMHITRSSWQLLVSPNGRRGSLPYFETWVVTHRVSLGAVALGIGHYTLRSYLCILGFPFNQFRLQLGDSVSDPLPGSGRTFSVSHPSCLPSPSLRSAKVHDKCLARCDWK